MLDANAGFSSVAAGPRQDVWLTGTAYSATNDSTPFLLHGDGGREWRREPVPDAFADSSRYELRLHPTGGDGVWLIGLAMSQAAVSGGGSTAPGHEVEILRRDGSDWAPVPAPPAGRFVDLVSFGAEDVWLLLDVAGDAPASENAPPRSRVAHWDGTRWTSEFLPYRAAEIDGTSGHALWAVGSRSEGPGVTVPGPGRTGESSQPATMRYDGERWTSVRTPPYHFPDPVPPEAAAGLTQLTARAPDDVTAYGNLGFDHGESDPEPDDRAIRLHWDGDTWRDLPAAEGGRDGADPCAGREPLGLDGRSDEDDRGGVFLTGRFYRAPSGACEKIARDPLPAKGAIRASSQQSLWVEDVTVVPGTDRVLGAATMQVNQAGNPQRRAVVVELRRG